MNNQRVSVLSGVLLAGGAGKRMLPLTEDTPKPLLFFNNNRLIDYSLVALGKINVKKNYIVVAYHKEQIIEHIGHNNTYYIYSNEKFNIFYTLYLVSEISRDDETLIFLDTDSVLPANILNEYFALINKNDCLIVRSIDTNYGSYWDFTYDLNGYVVSVVNSPNMKGRIFISLKSSVFKYIFKRISGLIDISEYKYENNFIPGYENYLLGWGLIYKLLVDCKVKVECIDSQYKLLNINQINDLI